MSHRRITWSAGGEALRNSDRLARMKVEIDKAAAAIDALTAMPEEDRKGAPEIGTVMEALKAVAYMA